MSDNEKTLEERRDEIKAMEDALAQKKEEYKKAYIVAFEKQTGITIGTIVVREFPSSSSRAHKDLWRVCGYEMNEWRMTVYPIGNPLLKNGKFSEKTGDLIQQQYQIVTDIDAFTPETNEQRHIRLHDEKNLEDLV